MRSRRFAGEPDTDLVLSDVSAASLDATVAGLPDDGATVETVLADVSDVAQVEAVVARAVERFGRLDVLISNAGVLSPNGRIHNLATEDWERAFRVNVLGAVNGIRAAVGVMRPQGSGSIVLTASVSGLTAWSHAAPYCATKAAVIQLAKVAAVEYARDGIRVNCVCPGTFRSAIHDEPARAEAIDAIAGEAPARASARPTTSSAPTRTSPAMRRAGRPASAIVVDGGYSAPVTGTATSAGDEGRRRLSATSPARSAAAVGLQPQVRVVVHPEPGQRREPRIDVAELAGVHAGPEHRLDPLLVVPAAPRNCSARSPVSAGNSCRNTHTWSG